MTSRWNARHWSERAACSCGATFNYPSLAEARHRHNFPMLCRKRRKKTKETTCG